MELYEKKDRAEKIIAELEKIYPEAICSLTYSAPHELVIAARLSAQCTDARVNLVTPELFEKFPSVDAFADANPADIEKIIYSCGFYRTKAADIVNLCRKLRDDFGGKLPDTIELLLTLPGIGRKTANLILGDIFKKPAVVCDTHCIRICNRLGLAESKEPQKCEAQLKEILPPEKSSDFCHRIVLFGRDICSAQRPKCASCPFVGFCGAKQ